MDHRDRLEQARITNNWYAAQTIVNELINLTEVPDEAYLAAQKKAGEDLAERMNKNEAQAKSFGKPV